MAAFFSLFLSLVGGQFSAGIQTIKMSPCKQRLMGRWGGEKNTIKSDRENTLLWLKSHKSMFCSKNNPRSYLSAVLSFFFLTANHTSARKIAKIYKDGSCIVLNLALKSRLLTASAWCTCWGHLNRMGDSFGNTTSRGRVGEGHN